MLITPSFPASHTQTFTASSLIAGSISLRLETEGQNGRRRFKLDEVRAKLSVEMWSSFFQPEIDLREERTELHSQDLLLWSASSSSSSLPSAGAPPPVLELPFSFVLPGREANLPPSFEGGDREGKTKGHVVGRVVWAVKISGHKAGRFDRDERMVLPFVYMFPPTINASSIPRCIVPRPSDGQQSLSPVAPPRPTAQDGWTTSTVEKEYKETLLGKKSKVDVKFSLPSLPTFPRNTPIPYYLSLLVLAPEGKGGPDPPALTLPSPSEIRLSLRRTVSTTAKKGSQKHKQDAGVIIDLKNETRVWYGPRQWMDVEGGGKRWGGEIVMVGEFELGGLGMTPSFGGEGTRGLLGCDYAIRLQVPLKGLKNDLDEHKFLPIVISSDPRVGQEQEDKKSSNALSSDLPPDYFSLAYEFGDEKEGIDVKDGK